MPQVTQAENAGQRQYVDKLQKVLLEIDPGFGDDRRSRVLRFFAPEIRLQDEKFLTFLKGIRSSSGSLSVNSLLRLSKFGYSNKPILLNRVANALHIPFGVALLQTAALAALGLAERPDTDAGGLRGHISAVFAPGQHITFVLNVLNMERFDLNETMRLLQFFAPEMKAKRSDWAIKTVQAAVNAINAAEEDLEEPLPIHGLIEEIVYFLKKSTTVVGLGTRPKAVPLPHLASQLAVSQNITTFCVLAAVVTGIAIERDAPFYTREGGGQSVLNLRLRSEQASVKETTPMVGEEDDLEDIFGGLEAQAGVVPDFSIEEIVDTMSTMENALHEAEELSSRVERLEAGMRTVLEWLGLEEREADDHDEDDIRTLNAEVNELRSQLQQMTEASEAVRFHMKMAIGLEVHKAIRQVAAEMMPNSKMSNTTETRSAAAHAIADAVLEAVGIDLPVDDEDLKVG